ncbi:CHAT domain-containing protein [Janthinobacterium sp. PLB04]|uniref:CHAT domain-containing protein n=1 Tax=Janthinobacterium lividum TaxID=29581 RepID=A0AAJ4T394_9BURK|nr:MULTISPECIES: CHAT domain-containing protein [Janthinobacterium]KAB0325099.1 CHAT domain-containing protein [Janthinobacterium lividum]QSX94188.1 CHAT domain-containing protein [Janthinobacterium lividum]UGQ33956.1 CHAT domain-containing protein [Janthinobacterium sp. PLB04]
MSLFTRLFFELHRRLSEYFLKASTRQQEPPVSLETAYSAYCFGSMRTGAEMTVFLASWMRDNDNSLATTRLIVDILMRDVKEDTSDHSYRQRCRFCARMVASVPSDAIEVHEHPAYAVAFYSLNCFHPYLFKEILIRLLRSSYGRGLKNKADLFVQLAVAFDFQGNFRRAETLLLHVQTMSRTGAVRPLTADFALRLLATVYALQAKIATVLLLYAEAEPHVKAVYGLSSLQIDIAWTLAVCRNAMGAMNTVPPLVVISVAASKHIAKRRAAAEDLVDVDMLMHGLDRGRYAHLSTLSGMMSLRIMREAPPPDLDGESLAMAWVNAGNAMLRNVSIASEWNLAARHYFEELIKHVNSGEILTSPDVQYQVALAHAGIGYSYSNLAMTAQQGEQPIMYTRAKEHLDVAIDLLQQLGRDGWIETRVWAAAGRVEAACGHVHSIHRRFAAALLAGATYYQLNVEDLVQFFCPDDDTRVKYSEVLAELGHTNTAILFAKAAVSLIHHQSVPLEEIAELAPAYIGPRTMAHRTLINELSKVGRYNEGELAYDLLKENEYNEFTQRSNTEAGITQAIALTPFELEAIRRSGLSTAVLGVKCLDQREATVNRLAEIFESLDGTIQALIDSRRFADALEYERRGIDPTKNLGKADAIIRFIASGSTLSVSFSTYREKKQLALSIDLGAVKSLIFLFRQQCRSSSSDLPSLHLLGQQLYQILLNPIKDAISKEITHLYIETDQLLASIPFAALHDGYEYLIQRFSLTYLNRVALNTNAEVTLGNTKHAAIFACTNVPGDELPGAAREVKIISEQLGMRSSLDLDFYIDQECRTEDFLREITRPRGGQGLIHLATHASFDPSNDASSSLAFLDKKLSIRTLRTLLEKSSCDTGLFVLSACGTARQDIDVEGFSSVLLRSGVRTVLATLWETFDDSAPEFFQRFYAHITDLTSASAAASAARAAQLALLTSNCNTTSAFVHPAHWAPYIVTTAQIS